MHRYRQMSALQVELLYFVVDIFMISVAKVNFVKIILHKYCTCLITELVKRCFRHTDKLTILFNYLFKEQEMNFYYNSSSVLNDLTNLTMAFGNLSFTRF